MLAVHQPAFKESAVYLQKKYDDTLDYTIVIYIC